MKLWAINGFQTNKDTKQERRARMVMYGISG